MGLTWASITVPPEVISCSSIPYPKTIAPELAHRQSLRRIEQDLQGCRGFEAGLTNAVIEQLDYKMYSRMQLAGSPQPG